MNEPDSNFFSLPDFLLADIDERIATLHALRNRLTTCIGCGCLSIDRCSLLNPGDEAGGAGPGAHYFQQDSRRA